MRATVFGLDVLYEEPVPFLAGARANATGRELKLGRITPTDPGLELAGAAELVCDERQPDGAVNFQIHSDSEHGFLIAGPGYGRLLLAADGSELRYAQERPQLEWQRLLIAQALPFAALLHGLEVFHASAVTTGGHAIAFLGPSHSGKTSVALELCAAEGYGFLADDVLAVQALEGELIGHPGSPLVALDRAQDGLASPEGEELSVNERERLVGVRGASSPAPLRALFFLDRRPDGPATPRFEPAVGAQMLLAATFNFVLATETRLRGLLDVCALAASSQVERIALGGEVKAGEVAAAVAARLGSCA